MVKPDSNFRMKSTYKAMITLMKGSKEERAHFKSMMIDAQLSDEAARRAALKSKDTKTKDFGKFPASE